MPLPFALPLVLGGVQAATGLIGRLLNKRPKYEIPDSVQKAVALAQLQANSRMPGFDEAQENIDVMSANAIRGAQTSGSVAEVLPGILGSQEKAYRNIAGQEAQYAAQAQQAYQERLMQFGQEQEKEWQLNKFAPFSDRQKLFEDMFGAGAQNLMSGATMKFFGNMMGLGESKGGVPSSGAINAPLSALPTSLPGSVQSMYTQPEGLFPFKPGAAYRDFVKSQYLTTG